MNMDEDQQNPDAAVGFSRDVIDEKFGREDRLRRSFASFRVSSYNDSSKMPVDIDVAVVSF